MMPMSATTTSNRARAAGALFSNVQPRASHISNMNNNYTESLNLFDDFGGGYGMSNANVMDEYAEKKVKGKVAFEEIQATGEYMETHYYK